MSWRAPGYTQLRELGSGGGGSVVLARHDATGAVVAIKYLSEHLLRDEGFRAQFRREAELLGQVDSPNVARLYEYIETSSGAAIVMEAVQGVTLRELIKHSGPTGPEAALVVLKGSLLGLAAAHRLGVVHRDYKPANVLVDLDGVSKLVDFGIAVRSGAAAAAAGTPMYMAPEQWEGQAVTPQSDIYAATATVVECLRGAPPFTAENRMLLAVAHLTKPVDLVGLPGPLHDLVRRGMAKEQAQRPGNAAAFVAELDRAAVKACGKGWEERGRVHLAARVAALAFLLPVDGTDAEAVTRAHDIVHVASRSRLRSSWSKGNRLALTTALVAVLVAGGIVLAVGGRTGPDNTTTVAAASGAVPIVEGPADPIEPQSIVPGPTGPDPEPAPGRDAEVLGVTAEPAAYRGECAGGLTTIGFRAGVAGPPGSTIRYRWLRSDGVGEPEQSVRVPASGRTEVTSQWQRGPGSGWRALELISPDAERSAPATFSAACEQPPPPQPQPPGPSAPPVPPVPPDPPDPQVTPGTSVRSVELVGVDVDEGRALATGEGASSGGYRVTGTARVVTSGEGEVRLGLSYSDGDTGGQALSGSTSYEVPFEHTFPYDSGSCRVTAVTTPAAPGGPVSAEAPCKPVVYPTEVTSLDFARLVGENGHMDGVVRVLTSGPGPVSVSFDYSDGGAGGEELSGSTTYDVPFTHDFAQGTTTCRVTVSTSPAAPGGAIVGDRPCAPPPPPPLAVTKLALSVTGGTAEYTDQGCGEVEFCQVYRYTVQYSVETNGPGPVVLTLTYNGSPVQRELSGGTSYGDSFEYMTGSCNLKVTAATSPAAPGGAVSKSSDAACPPPPPPPPPGPILRVAPEESEAPEESAAPEESGVSGEPG